MVKRIFKDNRAHLPEPCRPGGEIISRFGDKWSLLILPLLLDGQRMRFSELESQIEGISQRMLTMTLRALERDGFVTRIVHATVPPRVEYELTQLGHSVIAPLAVLSNWAHAHIDEIDASRRRFDQRQEEDGAKAEFFAGPRIVNE
jgi:DNA-binding HxlR family transcriptional regulator